LIALSHFHLELLLKKNQDIPIAGKVASKSHAWNIKCWPAQMKRNLQIGFGAGMLLIALWYVGAMWKGVMVHTARDTAFEITKDALWSAYARTPFPSRDETATAIAQALATYKGPAIRDEWGMEYRVEIPAWSPTGGVAQIRSAGKDRQYDTLDDKIVTIETRGRQESGQQTPGGDSQPARRGSRTPHE
jgi:hypothetical protein